MENKTESFSAYLSDGTETWEVDDAATLGFPTLTLEFKGELIQNNVTEFETSVMEWINSIPENPETDEQFAQAEDAVKQIKTAEDFISQRLDTLYPDEIQQIRERLKSLLGTMSTKRLGLDKSVKLAKVAKREAAIESALDSVSNDRMVRKHYRTIFEAAIKGKRTIRSIQEVLNLKVNVAFNTLQKNRGLLESFAEKYGDSSLPDRFSLLVSQSEYLEDELRRRADKIASDARERELKEQLAKERAERERAERERREAEAKAIKKPDPAPDPAPAPFIPIRRPTPSTSPVESSPVGIDAKAEWKTFSDVVMECAQRMAQARVSLKDRGNIEAAQKFAGVMRDAWRDANAR